MRCRLTPFVPFEDGDILFGQHETTCGTQMTQKTP